MGRKAHILMKLIVENQVERFIYSTSFISTNADGYFNHLPADEVLCLGGNNTFLLG